VQRQAVSRLCATPHESTQALSPDADRRVTVDRAVWTKPLALAGRGGRLWALNRTSPRRSGARGRDGCPIETVRTSQARGVRMCMDTVTAVRTDLRQSPVRARLRAEGDTPAPLTSCHRRSQRGAGTSIGTRAG
jgi:hypothetical protein